MNLDLEDFRPEAPRVPPVISTREGILLSIIVHMALVITVLMMPAGFFEPSADALLVPPPPSDEPVRYVHMEPLVERPAPPPPDAPSSDLDRQAATVVQPPDPVDPGPASQGNTSERIVGAPEQRAAGADVPPAAVSPDPPTPTPPADATGLLLPAPPPAQPAVPRGSLGDSLRDFQRYLNDQNFDNLRGGQTEFGPDIQFDSRGIDFGPWIRRFRAQVINNWNAPRNAMRSDHVVIQFDLYKNGRISNVRVVRPAAIEGYTIAARNAIQRSNPTLPLPEAYPVEPVVFTVTFFYEYRAPHIS